MYQIRLNRSEKVDREGIIGIFDLDNATVSGVTRDFLRASQKRRELVSLDNDIPRCFVLTRNKAYTSSYTVKHMMSKLVGNK